MIAKTFHISPDELFNLSWFRYMFFVSILNYWESEANPEEIKKGPADFDREIFGAVSNG